MKGENTMSEKYNDEKIKKIFESENIPTKLEPENIRTFLDNSSVEKKSKKIKHSKLLRIVSMAAALAVVLGTSVYFMKPTLYDDILPTEKKSDSVVTIESMASASAYSDVYSYFFSASKLNKFRDYIFGGFARENKSMDVDEAVVYEEAESDGLAENNVAKAEGGDESSSNAMASDQLNGVDESSQENDFSDTFSQETGVLEADIVKTDGNNIFYSNGDTLYISQTNNGKFVNPYKTDISEKLGLNADGSITDMYIYNGKLITICEYYESMNDTANYAEDYSYYYGGGANTYVTIFDIADPLKVVGYYVQEGSYNDVRLMSDGYLYVISNDNKYLDYNQTTSDDIENYIPEYCIGTTKCYVEPDNIMIPANEIIDVYDYVSYTNISGLNLNSDTPNQPIDMKSIAGYTNTIYCTQQNLYVVSGYDESEITRFGINEGMVELQASGVVNGYVNDQFSMSEYNGYFRIAVTEDVWEEAMEDAGEDSSVASNTWISQKNSVYVLDMDMNVVGSIGNFGLDEQIKSVNFSGDIAYIVTFRQTDPLYAIDLSNPAAPVILDEFKISGYSSYMQQWGDGLLLGFGAEADEETGWETGVKITMFDNSDPNNLKEIDTVSFVGSDEVYTSSEGIYERKALFIDPKKNIIGFPIESSNHTNDSSTYNYEYQFYSFENEGFAYKGEIEKNFEITSDYYGSYSFENFRRVVYIDGYFYAVSMDEFKSADAATFTASDSYKF